MQNLSQYLFYLWLAVNFCQYGHACTPKHSNNDNLEELNRTGDQGKHKNNIINFPQGDKKAINTAPTQNNETKEKKANFQKVLQEFQNLKVSKNALQMAVWMESYATNPTRKKYNRILSHFNKASEESKSEAYSLFGFHLSDEIIKKNTIILSKKFEAGKEQEIQKQVELMELEIFLGYVGYMRKTDILSPERMLTLAQALITIGFKEDGKKLLLKIYDKTSKPFEKLYAAWLLEENRIYKDAYTLAKPYLKKVDLYKSIPSKEKLFESLIAPACNFFMHDPTLISWTCGQSPSPQSTFNFLSHICGMIYIREEDNLFDQALFPNLKLVKFIIYNELNKLEQNWQDCSEQTQRELQFLKVQFKPPDKPDDSN